MQASDTNAQSSPTSTGADDAQNQSSQRSPNVDVSSSDTLPVIPLWQASKDDVTEGQIKLTQQCQKKGFHSVTPWFSDHGVFEEPG